MVGLFEALLHPLWNVTAGRDFPFVDARDISSSWANPESPLAIAACEADEDVGHTHRPRAGLCRSEAMRPRAPDFCTKFCNDIKGEKLG
jgi:hypothetical protein